MWVENGFLQVSVVQTKTAATADFIIESIGFLLSFFLCSLSSDILDTDLVKLYLEYFKQRKQAGVESKRLWLRIEEGQFTNCVLGNICPSISMLYF